MCRLTSTHRRPQSARQEAKSHEGRFCVRPLRSGGAITDLPCLRDEAHTPQLIVCIRFSVDIDDTVRFLDCLLYTSSDADAWALTGLRTGEWGIHIPGLPMDFVAHTLLPTEKKLVASDQATRQRTASTPVSSIPSVQARLDRLVELQSSADPYVIGVET